MTTRFHDTLSGATRPFVPLEPGHARIYSCGPTVYGPAHIGNFRSFVFADLLVRYLRYRGLRVTWVMNFTDIDDRIIERAREAEETIGALTDRWIAQFHADAAALRMTTPDVLPRATEHIAEIAALIAKLEAAGHAYRTDDGSIYFRIASWPAYGRLARLDPANMRVGERVEADDYGKDDVRDFALWKGPKSGEPSWDTEIGPGRPGWHIECSAMSMRHLGPSFDIHTGGVDLIFPHHEDELAQSEGATGVTFVGTWMHCAHLRLGGAKMARRDGNVARVADLLATGTSPRALRYALLSVNYRQGIDYSDASLAAAGAAIDRLDTVVAALSAYRPAEAAAPGGAAGGEGDIASLIEGTHAGFEAALDDDLNISAALAVVFDLVRELNRRMDSRTLTTEGATAAISTLRDLDKVLALLPDEEDLDPDLAALIAARQTARDARDWQRSDTLRDELLGRGISVEDTRDGQRWRRLGDPS